jgi:acyl-CoA synthetase (AMP-forming)/AMP-acid ligase II
MQRAEEAYGVPMLEAYGMTEASHQMASNPLPPGERKPGSVGVASGVEIRIVNGEVTIKGPGVTPGYLNNPEANADSFFEDGWFRTGDRGSLDADGYLRLEGRIKEMILRGGENISPYEIEEVLLAHPAVADAIAFGIDDEKYGERVGAAVTISAEVGERELIDHCRERLAAFKVPETVFVLESIPRTPTGKVQRKRVGESLTQTSA